MSYKARVYNVFIASPSDVSEERLAVRAQLEEWNTFHSEERNMVLLPIGWETHAMSEVGINPQDAINQTLLYKCDLLVGILWSKIGHPTPREKSGTIDEIKTHCSMGKPAILFFSKKSLPYDADLNQVNEIKKFKEEYMDKCIYIEYSTIEEFKNKLYEQIELAVNSNNLHASYDSDKALFSINDTELVDKINGHLPIVAKRILMKIVDGDHDIVVWDALINKLVKSHADLRDALYFMTDRAAFSHVFFVKGSEALAKCSQPDFFCLLTYLYTKNIFAFKDLYGKKYLTDENFIKQIENMLEKDKRMDKIIF